MENPSAADDIKGLVENQTSIIIDFIGKESGIVSDEIDEQNERIMEIELGITRKIDKVKKECDRVLETLSSMMGRVDRVEENVKSFHVKLGKVINQNTNKIKTIRKDLTKMKARKSLVKRL